MCVKSSLFSTIRSIFTSPVTTRVCFWEQQIYVRETAIFQLSISSSPEISLSSLTFSSLAIHFSDDSIPPLIVQHSPSSHASVQKVDLGDVSAFLNRPSELEGDGEAEAETKVFHSNLCWEAGSMIVFTGTMSSEVPIELKVPLRTLFPSLFSFINAS